MLKLFKMLQQIVSQLEQICLKLGLKNDYTLAVSNFTRQFVPQKWSGAGKSAITITPLSITPFTFFFHFYQVVKTIGKLLEVTGDPYSHIV